MCLLCVLCVVSFSVCYALCFLGSVCNVWCAMCGVHCAMYDILCFMFIMREFESSYQWACALYCVGVALNFISASIQ